MECYKLIDKSILSPGYIQTISFSSTSDSVINVMKQFIVVWLRIAGDQDNILTLKLWVNFLQKVSLLKAVKNQ